MRLNKVSELIHNSSNHQNLESAGVSVHFQEIVDLVRVSFFSNGWIIDYDACIIYLWILCYFLSRMMEIMKLLKGVSLLLPELHFGIIRLNTTLMTVEAISPRSRRS